MKMTDSTIITHADVYNELPSTSTDNLNGSNWSPSVSDKICSAHFINGIASNDPLSPSYAPKIFSNVPSSKVTSYIAAQKSVMMSADSSPTLQTSVSSPNYVDLPDEPRPGKITPSTNTTNSSPSPRATKSEAGGSGGGSSSPEVEEAIEEAVPIVRSTLPSPEPRPQIERNGYGKDHDRVDGNNGIKAKPIQHDVDDDSCLIKCVYFTQQCCECTIV